VFAMGVFTFAVAEIFTDRESQNARRGAAKPFDEDRKRVPPRAYLPVGKACCSASARQCETRWWDRRLSGSPMANGLTMIEPANANAVTSARPAARGEREFFCSADLSPINRPATPRASFANGAQKKFCSRESGVCVYLGGSKWAVHDSSRTFRLRLICRGRAVVYDYKSYPGQCAERTSGRMFLVVMYRPEGELAMDVRQSDIENLEEKVKKLSYDRYLPSLRLSNVRSFTNQTINFDFPVTAIIGTNGGGKSTILGAVALAYKGIKPGEFFPKSNIGDTSMTNWRIDYDIIDRKVNKAAPIQRNARFASAKWRRDAVVERNVVVIPIQRTVPANEQARFKQFVGITQKTEIVKTPIDTAVLGYVSRILGKDAKHYERVSLNPENSAQVGGSGIEL
jgi:hypothetical protein